ncbi:hypothetical protein AX17_002244 [Amanita inopinata Kibby_2008]|nr:hypothetical protein AX17_002244 [Amanita inopinata Kibby_2008]
MADLSLSAPTSLCPGYQHVEEFGPDEEYESGEEVSYVTFDLGNIEPTLVPSSSTYRLIGLDTPTPYLQLSGTVLKGRHDSLLGTELLFMDEKDAQDRNKRPAVHVANTEQRVIFKEVRLQPKAVAHEEGASARGANQQIEMRQSEDQDAGIDVDLNGAADEGLATLSRTQSKRGAARRKKSRKRGKGKAKASETDEMAEGEGIAEENEGNAENAMDTSAG